MTGHGKAAQERIAGYSLGQTLLSLLRHALVFGAVLSGLAWMHFSAQQGGTTLSRPPGEIAASILQ